jgi:hypothetical protein
MSPTLRSLNQIPAYGRVLYAGNHYSIKYRKKTTTELSDNLLKLKAKHPELLIYPASTGNTIFGGTFNKLCSFLEDKRDIVGT